MLTTIIQNFNFDEMAVWLDEEIEWLSSVLDQSRGWASHHAAKHRCSPRPKDISTILPIINKEVHKLGTQYHCMKIVNDTIKSWPNPCQYL